MSWSRFGWGAGGEHQDVEMEFPEGENNMALQSTNKNTGDDAIRWNHSAASAHQFTTDADVSAGNLDGKLIALSGLFKLSGTPSSDIALLTQSAGARLIRIGTDKKLRVYDKSGAVVAGPSSAALSTVALERVTVWYDDLTLLNVWIVCMIEDTEEFAVNTGLSMGDLFAFGSGRKFFIGDNLGSRGADLDGDDVSFMQSTTAGDAPHLERYRKYVAVGGFMRPPTADGSHTAWSNNGYLDVDESPPDDSTTEVGTVTKGAKETYHAYDDTVQNPIPTGFEISYVTVRAKTQLVDAAKLGTDILLRDASANEVVLQLIAGTTTYTTKGGLTSTNPAGGVWVRGDFDDDGGSPKRSKLQFGLQSQNNPDVDTAPNVTAIYLPEVWCDDPTDTDGNRHPTTTTPVAKSFPIKSRVMNPLIIR